MNDTLWSLLQNGKSDLIREVERHVINNQDYYFDVSLTDDTKQLVMQLLTDIQAVNLFPAYCSYCYLVASFVFLLFASKNIRVQLIDCGAVVATRGGTYTLGLGQSQKDQIDGHIACLIGDRVMVDLGLGAVSKYLVPGFPQGIVCRAASGPNLATVALPGGQRIDYVAIPEPAQKRTVLQQQQAVVDELYRRWQRLRSERS